MPNYKLYYFNGRGAAEVIRLVFAQAGVEYEDVRLTWDGSQWAEFKPKTPYGVMPVLDIDGKVVGGSMPITRYLARQFGLAGDDDMARLVLEGAEDAINDFKTKMYAMFFEKDEEKKATLKKDLTENVIPMSFGALERLAASNTACAEGWFHGSKVSYVDFFFTHIVEYIMEHASPNAVDDYPALKKLTESVKSLPNIAKWIKERPQTPH